MYSLNSFGSKHQHFDRTIKEKVIKDNWNKFFLKGLIPSGVRPVIMSSWKRSLNFKVNPKEMEAKKLCCVKEIKERREKYSELLTLIRPFMDDLFEIVKGTDSIIAFSDKEGVVLELFGDSEIALNASSVNFKIGVHMSEETIGTNSIGLAIRMERAIQVIGAEHFCTAWHTSNCSSAPILDPVTHELIGTISLIGYLRSAHPHSLALVKTAADTIAKLIEQQGIKQEKYLLNNFFNAAINSISDGILIINRYGEVIHSNKMATHLLKILPVEKRKYKLDELELLQPFSNYLMDNTQANEIILQDEISLPQEEKFKILITTRRIVSGNEFIGNIIILKKKVSKEVRKLSAKYHFSSLIGSDSAFNKSIQLAFKASKTDKSILIIGESGTGKELFAQAIHNESSRQNEPFLAINCAAIPKDLITSELFGYIDGAFTNAAKGGKIGKFEAANGGTIFLDEIGDMPLELQAHLLRVLEEKEITPVGSYISKPIDLRIIAATNKDLFQLVKENKFRLDLFYRLNVITVEIPALKKRKQDIELLVKNFLPYKKISDSVLKVFYQYDWPGNLRELKNVMEQVDIFCDEEIVTEEFLPSYLLEAVKEMEDSTNLYQAVSHETKKDTLVGVLNTSASVSEAAKRLGVSPSTLYRWASEYQVNVKELLNTTKSKE